MMTRKFLSGSAMSLIFSSGLPSTSSRSAIAPSCDHAKFARVRVDKPGKRHQRAVIGSRHLERFGGRVPAHQLRQDRSLTGRQPRIEQNVGTEGRFDVVFSCKLVRIIRAGVDHQRFLLRHRVHQWGCIFVIEKRLQAPPDALVREQFGGGFINQLTVLDTLNSGGDCLPDCTRRVGVHRDIRAPILGGLNSGTNLRFGVLRRLDRIVGRGNAAAGHELDLAGALPQLLPGSQSDFVGAVGNGRDTLDLGVAQRASERAGNFKGEPEISMPGGLRDKSARRIDARTNGDTFVDGAFKSKDGTPKVANGREPPHQRRLGLSRGQELEVIRIGGHEHHLRRRRHEGVPMGVDQPRHQDAPARRNGPNLGVGIDGNRALGYARDGAVFDQYVGRNRKLSVPAIEDTNILKERDTATDRSGERLQTRRFQIRIALRQACAAGSGHERRSQNKRCHA